MATEVGAAYGRLGLNIDELRTNFNAAKTMLTELRTLAAPIVANMKLTAPNASSIPQAGAGNAAAQSSTAVAAAAGKAAAAVGALTREEERAAEQAIRVSTAQQAWTTSIAKLTAAEQLHGKSSQFVTNLALLRAQAEKGNNAVTDAQAVATAKAAAATFNYGAAQKALTSVLSDTTITQERRIALERELSAIQRESVTNSNAAADAERKRLATTQQGARQALAQNRQQQVGLAPSDPRKLALLKEERQLTDQVAAGQRLLAQNAIDAAVSQNDFKNALRLVSNEMKAVGKDAQLLGQFQNQLNRITKLQTQATQQAEDAYRKEVTALKGVQAALKQNTTDRGNAPSGPTGDSRRQALDKERLTLQAALATQNRKTADSEIALARAAGDHTKAYQLVAQQLTSTSNSQARNNELTKVARQIILDKIAAVDAATTRDAKAAAASGDFAKSQAILAAAINKTLPGTDRRIALQNTLNGVLRQATASGDTFADTLTAQLVAMNQLSAAQARVTGLMAAAGKGTQREADLKLQLLNINKQLFQAEQGLQQAVAGAARSQQNYTQALAALNTAQAQHVAGSRAYLQIQTQKNYLTQQAVRQGQQVADAEIKAARASRDYAAALALINTQLQATVPNSQRYFNLLAQQSVVTRQAGGWFALLAGAAKSLLVPFAAASIALRVFGVARDQIVQGLDLVRNLQENERGVSALFNSMARGNDTMQSAIAFGQKYGFTQKEMGQAAAEAAVIMQTSNATAEETFSVLARLQSRAPGKTFNDAVRSVAELQSGQLQSIQRVFNVPARFAQEMRDAIESGIDPIQAIDTVLAKLGQTNSVLQARNQGLSREFRNVELASEAFKRSLGELLEGPATGFLRWAAQTLGAFPTLIKGFRDLSGATAKERFEGLREGFKSSGPDESIFLRYNVLVKTIVGLARAGDIAGERMERANQNVTFSLEELRQNAIDVAPYLADLGLKAVKPLGTFAEELKQNATSINAWSAQLQQGRITATEFGVLINSLRINDQTFISQDNFGWLEQIKSDFPAARDRAGELRAAIIAINTAMGAAPNDYIRNQYIPSLKAFNDELIRTEAKFPMELTIKFRIERANLIKDTANAILAEGKQLTTDLIGIDEQYATNSKQLAGEHLNNRIAAANELRQTEAQYASQSKADDKAFRAERVRDAHAFAKQQFADEVSFARERERTVRDFGRQMAQSERDFGLQRAKAVRDYGLQAARSERDFGQQRAKAVRDFGMQMERSERDFNQQRERSLRDYGQQVARSERDFAQQLSRSARDYGQSRATAIRDFGQQLARSARDFAQQMATSARDYNQQLQRSERDYQQGIQKTNRDFAMQNARSERDFARSEQRTLEDFERTRRETITNSAKAQEKALREHLRNLQKMQRDYEIDRNRSTEDFELERMVLLAEGRIAEAQVAQSKFIVEQRRNAEDYGRSRSDAGDDFARGGAEREETEAETAAQQQAEFDRARAQRLADFELQKIDAKAAHDLQLADSAAAHAQQRADTAAAFAQQTSDAKIAHAQQTADAKEAFAQQQRDAAIAYAQQLSDSIIAHAQQTADAATAFAQQQSDANISHAQQKADAKAAFDLQNEDARIAHEQQKSDTAIAFALQQSDALASHKLQRQDAITAHENQLQDTEDAHKLAQAEALNNFNAQQQEAKRVRGEEKEAQAQAHREELDALKKANGAREQQEAFDRVAAYLARQQEYATRLRDYETFVQTQKTLLATALAQQVEIAKIAEDDIERELKIMRIETANTAQYLADVFAKVDKLTTSAGAQAAVSYLEGLVRTLRDSAKTSMEIGLGPYANNAVPRSPIKEGPLKDHHIGAARVGKMYAEGLTKGLLENKGVFVRGLADYQHLMDTQIDAYKQLRDMEAYSEQRASAGSLATNPTYVAGGVGAQANRSRYGGGGGDARKIEITLSAQVTMDGKRVGHLVAPHVAQVMADDLEITATVVNAVYTPGVHQEAFRR